jgi:hypothetical protein
LNQNFRKWLGLCFTATAFLAVVAALPGESMAKQYTVGTGRANPVDIRVTHGRIVGYEIKAPARCAAGGGNTLPRLLFDAAGRAFGSRNLSKRLRRDGRFALRYPYWFRGQYVGRTVLKGRVSQRTIRGGYSLKTFPDSEGNLGICWTGKGRKNTWVKFVARAR